MKNRLKIIPWLVVLCFLVTLIAIVQPPLAKAEKKEILIGAHVPLTGVTAGLGVEQKWAYEKAVEDINKAGGIFIKEYGKKLKVRIKIVDDNSNPMKAASIVERLIKMDKVDLMLSGSEGTLGTTPGMAAAEKLKTYYHGTVCWVPQFLQHNFKYSTLYFYDIRLGGSMPFDVWKGLPKDQRPTKIGLMLEKSPGGKMIGDAWTKLAEIHGYQIACRESIGVGDKDVSSQVRKAKEAGADALLVFAGVPESIALVRQMKENNFSVKFFQGVKGTWPWPFYKALGKDSDYVFADGFWSMDYPFDGAKELGVRYYKETGRYSVAIGMYYALCQTLWQAIEKAGTLEDLKVRQAVLDNEFSTVNGTVKYDKKGVALFPPADFQWWQGKQLVVFPFELTEHKIKLTPPWNKR